MVRAINYNEYQNYQQIENQDITTILLYALQLASNYDEWINENNISEILNSNKNTLHKMLKFNNPQLCEKSINSIIIGFYMYTYKNFICQIH